MDNLEQPIRDLEFNFLDINTIFKFCPDGIVYKDKIIAKIIIPLNTND